MSSPTPTVRRKLHVLRLVLLLIGLAAIGGGLFALHRMQAKSQAASWLARAKQAADQQQWDDAASFYQTYLNFHRDDADAIAAYSNVLEKANEGKPGAQKTIMDVYERLLRLDPRRSEQRKKLARYYLDLGQHSNSRDHLQQLLDPTQGGNPDDAELLEMLAACVYATTDEKERKLSATGELLVKAVRTGKATPDACLRLAILLRNEIRTPEAEQEADAVMNDLIATRSDNIAARLARARYRASGDDLRGASADIDAALKLPGGDRDLAILLAKADLAVREENLPAAQDVLTKAIAVAPNDPRVSLALADVQAKRNDPAAALRTLKAATASASRVDLQLLELTDRLIDLGDLTSPAEYAKRFAAEKGGQPFADYLNGRLKLAEGNWPAALTLLKQAASAADLQRVPGVFLKAQLAIGDCYGRANNPDQQLATFTTASRAFPDNAQAKFGQAEALARLGKLSAAADLFLATIPQLPAARLPFARLRFAEVLAQPEASQNWKLFEDSLGAPPYSIDLELLRATAMLRRGKTPDAETLLADVAKRVPSDFRPAVSLAILKAATDPTAGLALLDQAEKEIGDRVAFRLARAQILARKPGVDPKSLLKFAENDAAFGTSDRAALNLGLGQLLLALGQPSLAIELYTAAAAASPYDLNSRAVLYELALAQNRRELAEKTRKEMVGIEGPAGPIGVAADVTASLPTIPPGDTSRIAELREKLRAATVQRESWGRLAELHGDLDQLDGQPDAALEHYRKAFDLGDVSDRLIRKISRLLLDRRQFPEALAMLTRYSLEAPLPPDLDKQLTLLRSMAGDDPKQGLAWARSAVAKDSKEYRDHLFRAAVFALADDNTEAEAALRKAVDLGPTAPEAWVALVRFLATNNRAADAATEYKRAAAKIPPKDASPADQAAGYVALGSCQELLGDRKAAESLFREAVAADRNNPLALRELFVHLLQTNRRSDAEDLLRTVIKSSAPVAVRRWARRTLALSFIDSPDGYSRLKIANELIDENLKDGQLLDDQRAKAVLVAADPFRRTEAIQLLTESAIRTPLTPEENVLLARLYLQSGRPDQAETALKEATRTAAVAASDQLAFLLRVQLQRDDLIGAKETVARLKSAAPDSWDAVSSEARVFAKSGNAEQAAKRLLAWSGTANLSVAMSRVAPLLDELGAKNDAEAILTKYRDKTPGPAGFPPLASFLIRSGRSADAVKLAREYEATAPPGLVARVYSAAVRMRPPLLVSEADRAAWQKTVSEVEAWIDAKLQVDPKNLDLLAARGELYDATDRIPEEIAIYEQALKQVPDNELVLNNLAVLLALQGKEPSRSRPLELINRVIAKRGPLPFLLDSRATIRLATGQAKDAMDDLELAISLDPRPVYYFHLAQAKDKLDDAPGRDAALTEAKRKGLTKVMLNPIEWPAFDRLIGK